MSEYRKELEKLLQEHIEKAREMWTNLVEQSTETHDNEQTQPMEKVQNIPMEISVDALDMMSILEGLTKAVNALEGVVEFIRRKYLEPYYSRGSSGEVHKGKK